VLRHLVIAALVLAATTGSPLSAQEWAKKMFTETGHDFGVVARGAKAEYRFEFQNIYEEDIHIAGVRSSCGCTSPEVTKRTLKTWEKAEIVATFNTRSFLGARNATLTVTIDKPYYGEVHLDISGYIRGDVVFEPGSINFGEVEQGETSEKHVRVNYAGRGNWEITDVRSANESFEVELQESERRGGSVSYEMIVRLKPDAPAGYINDQLTVVTNDGSKQSIPLAVEGRVRSALTISPTPVVLGIMHPGEEVEKKLLIRSSKEFHVTKVTCDDEDITFEVDSESNGKVHFVPLTFKASEAGKVERKIRIETDLPGSASAEVVASGEVKEETSDPVSTN